MKFEMSSRTADFPDTPFANMVCVSVVYTDQDEVQGKWTQHSRVLYTSKDNSKQLSFDKLPFLWPVSRLYGMLRNWHLSRNKRFYCFKVFH